MLLKNITFTALISLSLSSCGMKPFGGTYNFDGPVNASTNDFATEFYQCAQEASGNISSSSADLTVELRNGTPQNLPSCSMMRLCLAKQGYTQNDNGRFNSEAIAVRCIPQLSNQQFLQPWVQNRYSVTIAITMSDTTGLPPSYLVDYFRGTLNGSQPIPHRVTETVHRTAHWHVLLQPFVQCSAC